MESPLRHSPEPDLKLIETLLWDGMRYPRLGGHLARLTRSAEELGFRCDPETAQAALPKPAGPARVRLTLDGAGHDGVRATLPDAVDEALFLNERDEVCEGTITNLFFDRGQGLRTPPLGCGLLPGVLRAELSCPEEVLLAKDLGLVQLWVGNALRGLIPARLR